MSISKPNPAKAAKDRLEKRAAGEQSPAVPSTDNAAVDPNKPKRGRPPGSKTKSKTDDTTEKPKTPEEIAQEAGICAFLCATVWQIGVVPLTGRREITDDEALKLGGALAPVLNKYLPGLSGYGLEINLLLVVGMIWTATTPPKKQGEIPGKSEENISIDGKFPPGHNRLSLED